MPKPKPIKLEDSPFYTGKRRGEKMKAKHTKPIKSKKCCQEHSPKKCGRVYFVRGYSHSYFCCPKCPERANPDIFDVSMTPPKPIKCKKCKVREAVCSRLLCLPCLDVEINKPIKRIEKLEVPTVEQYSAIETAGSYLTYWMSEVEDKLNEIVDLVNNLNQRNEP